MAVKQSPQPKQLRDFLPKYQSRIGLLLFVIQFAVAASLIAIFVITAELAATSTLVIAISMAALIIITLTSVAGMALLAQPMKHITDALMYVSGEPGITVENMNSSNKYLRPVLESIYARNPGATPLADSGPKSDEELNRLPVGVAYIDLNGDIIYANLMTPTENINGKTQLSFLFQTDMTLKDWINQCEANSLREQKVWRRIADKPLGEPGRRIFDIIANYQKGAAIPVHIICIDRSDKYSPEDDELNFISFAAHELRGPITVIHGYLDALNDELENITPEQQELFDRLKVSSSRLTGYVNNILNSSRYDRRHLHLRLSEVRLCDIYASIADDMQLRARSQRRLLSVNIPVELPTVAADPSSISEVLGNLIDNAIKYCHEGGSIVVTAEVHDNSVEVDVTDNGIGMPPNVVKNLFHKFYRSHRSREIVAGAGIGLYISKAITESHGGTMRVRSVEGEGSTFTVSLPIYATVADKLQASSGDNNVLINNHSGGWIKNHGSIRG